MRWTSLSLALALSLGLTSPGVAQYWATRDMCDVAQAEIDPEVLPPDQLTELDAEAAAQPNPVGRFWRIQSPDNAVSHLWGTMHSTDPLILDLPSIVIDRITAARMVALEIDYIVTSRRKYEIAIDPSTLYRAARADYDFGTSGLDPQIIDWIRSRTHGVGWGRRAPDYLTLGALAEIVLTDPCDDFTAGVLPTQDGRIQMLGMIAGAEILGLEAPGTFRDVLNRPENEALALAVLAVYGGYLQPAGTSAVRATFFGLYKQGRIGVMQALDRAYHMDLHGPKGAAYYDLTDGYLVAQRNAEFLQTALPELRTGGVFMAIGSYHLPGEAGMIELLRREGFRVTRIPLAGEADTP